MIQKLKITRYIIVLIFISSFSVVSQQNRISIQKSLILDDRLSPDEIILKLYQHKKWGPGQITIKEWNQIKKILLSVKKKPITLRDQYFFCLIECNRYTLSKEIGKALYCLENFHKKVRELNDENELINVYQLFITIYSESNMIDDAIKYTDLLYSLKSKNKSYDEVMEFSNWFVWKYYTYGRYKKNESLLNKAQELGEKRINYYEKHPSNESGIGDDFKVNAMILLQLKKWEKAIKISKRGLLNFGLDIHNKDEGYLSYRRKLLTYISVAFAHLNNKDSALYYMDLPVMFQNKSSDRNLFITTKNKFLDGEEVIELINVFSILNLKSKAVELAYEAVYSKNKIKRKDFREYILSTFPKVFLNSGYYKEAAEGFKLAYELSDSISKLELKTHIEKESTHNRIELTNINEINVKKDEINKKKLERQILVKNLFISGFSIFLIFSIIIFFQRNKIKKGKKLSDELLLNILPFSIAEELKIKGSAESKLIDMVTVLFTDFKGFTQLSEKFTPQELVAEINECFSEFDKIMLKYNIEKIKTIGDAYMAAGGLPTSNKTHAQDVVSAAIEIQEYMSNYEKIRTAEGKLFFEIRIGIHSGPVVAGIVGIRKFAYDIWGDTVNIASRMESSGEVGKVNVSESTFELTKEMFKFEYRGKITAKGKGEINMYFVEQKQS